jgi:hypothetical protein
VVRKVSQSFQDSFVLFWTTPSSLGEKGRPHW